MVGLVNYSLSDNGAVVFVPYFIAVLPSFLSNFCIPVANIHNLKNLHSIIFLIIFTVLQLSWNEF